MIDIRLNCENCDKDLPIDSTEARMCAFECTFCSDCVENVLHNVCPNCGGGFEARPILPKQYREKYPPKVQHIYNPVDMETFKELHDNNKTIKPCER